MLPVHGAMMHFLVSVAMASGMEFNRHTVMAKELAPIVISCATWSSYLKRQHVLFECDNNSLVSCIFKGYS